MGMEGGKASGEGQALRRRRVMGGRRHRHVVRVTPEEEAQLLGLALRRRVSVPKLLVESALAGSSEAAAANATTRTVLFTELFGVHRLLASIANNVNQIARVANATGGVPPEASEVLAAVRRVADRIDELVDRLSP